MSGGSLYESKNLHDAPRLAKLDSTCCSVAESPSSQNANCLGVQWKALVQQNRFPEEAVYQSRMRRPSALQPRHRRMYPEVPSVQELMAHPAVVYTVVNMSKTAM